MEEKFPRNLQVGDKVIVGGRTAERVLVVERVTKTQLILSSTISRFRRDNGWQIGGGAWSKDYLIEATPEKLREVCDKNERLRLLARLRKYPWGDLSANDMKRVFAILPPVEP